MKTLILTLLVLFSISLSAQKVIEVYGEYTYHFSENVSLEQARETVLEKAKTAIWAEQFGTTVSQWNSTVVKNENGTSDITFLSLGGSEVKGEWLEDIKIVYSNPYYEQGMSVLSVSVRGKAREITSAGIDFSAMVLNNVESKYETDTFHNGEDIFLSFRSPVDGYLAVYLVDDEQTAFCILPYEKSSTGKVPIKANKDYLFFSKNHADPAEKSIVDGYVMTCKKSVEHNLLYIIFSPNEFTKANDAAGGEILPRKLSFENFQKWLTKNKTRDKNMKEERKSLTIKHK